ncbi:MAG TPA: hypothetical protein VIK20_04340 [Bacteroidales bacterium]
MKIRPCLVLHLPIETTLQWGGGKKKEEKDKKGLVGYEIIAIFAPLFFVKHAFV